MSKKNQGLRQIDAPIYSYWQALYMAFYSSRLYVDVAKRWQGYGVLYMLLLIVLASTPLSVKIIVDFKRYFDEQLTYPIGQLPPLYIQNGQVTFDKPMPYLIKNSAGEVVAIIDTTGKVTGIDGAYPKLSILVTKNKLHYRSPEFKLLAFKKEQQPYEGTVSSQTFDKNDNGIFVGKQWLVTSDIAKIKYSTEALIYPVLALFWFSLYTVFLMAFAYMGHLFALIIFKYRLKYKEACRLFLVASTPQVLVLFVLLTTNTTVPGGGIGYMVLLAVYFNYAIICVRRESNRLVRT